MCIRDRFGLAVGGVVIYGALADGAAAATGLPLSALVLGVAAAVANGITVAAGVLGRAASRNPGRAAALRSLDVYKRQYGRCARGYRVLGHQFRLSFPAAQRRRVPPVGHDFAVGYYDHLFGPRYQMCIRDSCRSEPGCGCPCWSEPRRGRPWSPLGSSWISAVRQPVRLARGGATKVCPYGRGCPGGSPCRGDLCCRCPRAVYGIRPRFRTRCV